MGTRGAPKNAILNNSFDHRAIDTLLTQFSFEEGTSSSYFCSAIVNGNMMKFGGEGSYNNQISVVESCRLRRVGSLPMEFVVCACTLCLYPVLVCGNTFQTIDRNDEALLCFGSPGMSLCNR